MIFRKEKKGWNSRKSSKITIACIGLLLVILTGCGQQMDNQPRYEPYETADRFPDNQSAKPLVPGTVAQEWQRKTIPERNPLPLSLALLERGQERFNIFCSPCHGLTGYGDGMIIQRGFPQPPSYHSERLRQIPDSHFFTVMTQGYGVMYSYAARVPARDRWAIVAYIRALQLSQHIRLDELPEGLPAADTAP